MSQSITNAFVQQFSRNIHLLSQQMGSMLRPAVRIEMVNAKRAFFDRLAPTEMQLKTSRHAPAPLVESVHDRRSVTLEDWGWGDIVDREDKIRMLISPESEIARNAVMAAGRRIDSTIVAAFTAAADEGQFGGTSTAFPAGNTIASGGAGLTVGRIREVKRRMDSNDVRDMGRYWAVSAQALEDMLEQTEITSSDFAMVKALVMGDVNTFLGFRFVRVSDTILPIDGSLDRSTFAWQMDQMGLALGMDIKTEMKRRPDLWGTPLNVEVTLTVGAVRIEDAGVFQVLVREV
jgi:hypothetical protein